MNPQAIAGLPIWRAGLLILAVAIFFAARTSIPAILCGVLIAGGALTVAFASFLGSPSLRMHMPMTSLLAISGALILVAIVALSNPFRGDFRVSPEPFERVLAHAGP